MRKTMVMLAVAIAAVMAAPSAGATTPRADAYYEVWCIDPSGALVQAETVDAHAIEQGGKDHAIALFVANHPAWNCWAVGPFN